MLSIVRAGLLLLLLGAPCVSAFTCNTYLGTDFAEGGAGHQDCDYLEVKKCIQRSWVDPFLKLQNYGMSCDDAPHFFVRDGDGAFPAPVFAAGVWLNIVGLGLLPDRERDATLLPNPNVIREMFSTERRGHLCICGWRRVVKSRHHAVPW